jgi:UDP-2-acetamido-3-amino-2,3-dideoxy-glucuronate N-acetyltransferase
MSMIHFTSEILTSKIGEGTRIWQYCVILDNVEIGNNCNINCFVYIENNVKIGNNVTIKSGVQIWRGVTLDDDVFVGPNVSFSNDKFPKSKNSNFNLLSTCVMKGASLGANSTILPGIKIGENSLVGAGSVVTKDIPPNEVWIGNPAKFYCLLKDLKV